jgi:hypothetical protein
MNAGKMANWKNEKCSSYSLSLLCFDMSTFLTLSSYFSFLPFPPV